MVKRGNLPLFFVGIEKKFKKNSKIICNYKNCTYLCITLKKQIMKNTTETQAIEIAKSMLKEGFTISLMNANEVEDFIWGYLYGRNLQSYKPIFYVDEHGNDNVAIVYEQG